MFPSHSRVAASFALLCPVGVAYWAYRAHRPYYIYLKNTRLPAAGGWRPFQVLHASSSRCREHCARTCGVNYSGKTRYGAPLVCVSSEGVQAVSADACAIPDDVVSESYFRYLRTLTADIEATLGGLLYAHTCDGEPFYLGIVLGALQALDAGGATVVQRDAYRSALLAIFHALGGDGDMLGGEVGRHGILIYIAVVPGPSLGAGLGSAVGGSGVGADIVELVGLMSDDVDQRSGVYIHIAYSIDFLTIHLNCRSYHRLAIQLHLLAVGV